MSLIKTMIAGSANPHIPGYLRGRGQKQFEFVAVADHDPVRLARDREILDDLPVRYHSDWRAMFDAHPEAEAVIIGTDNIDHLIVFREAVKRGLHIYMMKVISMDEAECREMLDLAKGYEKVIQVELELHFRPQFQYARRLLAENKLGQLKSIYLSNISQSPCNYFPNWGDPVLSYGREVPLRAGDRLARGGALTDHPHPFDLIRWLTGREFHTVMAMASENQRHHLRVEDNIVVTGRLDDGTPFMINPSYSHLEEFTNKRQLVWPQALECNLKLYGEKACFMADYNQHPLFVCGENHASPNRLMVDSQQGIPAVEGMNLLCSFYDCIIGKRSQPETGLNESYQAVRVMNAAYESLSTGQPVTLACA